jgi:hypothetical protein
MSTKKSKRTKQARIAEDTKLGDGVVTNYAKDASFEYSGAKHTVAEILAYIKARNDASGTVESTQAAWTNAVHAEKAVLAQSEPVLAGLRKFLLATLGNDAEKLAAFGLAPQKTRRALTAEELALAAKRRDATRAARGTRGSRQKARIVGQVPAPDPKPNGTPPHA